MIWSFFMSNSIISVSLNLPVELTHQIQTEIKHIDQYIISYINLILTINIRIKFASAF